METLAIILMVVCLGAYLAGYAYIIVKVSQEFHVRELEKTIKTYQEAVEYVIESKRNMQPPISNTNFPVKYFFQVRKGDTLYYVSPNGKKVRKVQVVDAWNEGSNHVIIVPNPNNLKELSTITFTQMDSNDNFLNNVSPNFYSDHASLSKENAEACANYRRELTDMLNESEGGIITEEMRKKARTELNLLKQEQ